MTRNEENPNTPQDTERNKQLIDNMQLEYKTRSNKKRGGAKRYAEK